jgi:electron transfer flavoprotein beta subunit
MKIIVCISNVPDTTTKVKFKDNNSSFDTTGVQWIINPWDELALTRALELKEDSGNQVSKVTVVNVGLKESEPTIRKALAIGADDAVRVDAEPTDPFSVAAQLTEALKGMEYDIVLCGIESSDYNGSAVGGMLSEMLDLPSVSAVSSLNIQGDQITMTRDIDGGKETVSASSSVVAIVQKGIAKEPRIAAMRGIMMARQKPIAVVQAAESQKLSEVSEFELPPAKAACKMIDADNVKELVRLLKDEAKAI